MGEPQTMGAGDSRTSDREAAKRRRLQAPRGRSPRSLTLGVEAKVRALA